MLSIIPNNDKVSKATIYPVGAIIITTVAYANSAAVVAVYGGTTWTEVAAGYFLKAVGTGNTAGNTAAAGNTGSTTLTAAQSGLPAHNHTYITAAATLGVTQTGDGYVWYSGTGVTTGNNNAQNASQGHTHTASNPASYGVHIWKRTA